MKQQIFAKHRKTLKGSKRGLKSTTVAAYSGVFLLIMSLVAIGYQPPQKITNMASVAATGPAASLTANSSKSSVDELVATNVAATIAERADLAVAPNISNLSVSLAVRNELAQTASDVITKPQIIQPLSNSREIRSYTAVAGDTAQKVGAKFNLSAQTIKWANDLTSDAIESGRKLTIPPIDGVIYKVESGDTIESIVKKYDADKERTIAYNDLEIGGLKVGSKIVIPGGDLPQAERPGYVAPAPTYNSTPSYSLYNFGGGGGSVTFLYTNTKPTSPGNSNAWGNCTWYAWERRAELGRPLPSRPLGNAADWAYTLSSAGYRVSNVPKPGSIMQNGGGYGHVAIVESVAANGDVTVTEMNYMWRLNQVTRRVVSASQAAYYNYIE